MSDISERVIAIVCDRLNVPRDQVGLETSFTTDLSADSLDIVELVMEIEDEFNLSIPDEEAENIKTVGDAIRYIEENS